MGIVIDHCIKNSIANGPTCNSYRGRNRLKPFDPSEKKKVLFLNQYYPPDQAATAGILARIVDYLSENFNITVLAGRPSYLSEKFRWKFVSVRQDYNSTILRAGSLSYPRKNILFRSLNYLTYLVIATSIAIFTKADIIIALTDPPLSGLIGAFISKLKKRKFMYYIQDLHPEMAMAAGMIKPGLITKIWSAIHKRVMYNADKILVIGDDMRENIIRIGIDANKIAVIRHGAVMDKSGEPIDERFIREVRKQYRFIFLHAGNLGFYGAWEGIIEGFKKLQNKNIGLIFVGEGQVKERLVEISRHIENIHFLPYQSREKVKSVLKAADVHIISIRNGLEGLVVPSKLYPILAANKPILGVCPVTSDTARIVNKFNCGLVVDPGTPTEIAAAMRYFYENRDKLPEYGQNAKRAAENFAQKEQLELLKQELENVLSYNSKVSNAYLSELYKK